MHRSRLACLAVGLGLLSPILVPASGASAQPDVSPLLSSGVLASVNGWSSEARVEVRVWPSPAVLDRLTTKDRFTLPLVASVKPSRSGRYAIRLNPAAVSGDYVANDGSVSLQFTFTDGTSESHWNLTALPVTLAGHKRSWATGSQISSGRGAGPARIDASFAERSVEINDLRDHAAGTTGSSLNAPRLARQWSSGRVTSARTFSPMNAGVSAQFESCTWRKGKAHYGLTEKYGVARGWSGAKITATMKMGTKHTLGIGEKIEGVGWAKAGSAKLELASGDEGEVARTVGKLFNQRLANAVNYQDWVFKNDGPQECVVITDRKPKGPNALLPDGLLTDVNSVHFADSKPMCRDYSSGDFTKVKGKNKTYGAGVDIGPISVSAQSGWNKTTSLTWHFKKRTWLCGNTNDGPATSPLVEAHAYRKPKRGD